MMSAKGLGTDLPMTPPLLNTNIQTVRYRTHYALIIPDQQRVRGFLLMIVFCMPRLRARTCWPLNGNGTLSQFFNR